jgi:Cof subfamily protein (haloacid dehalogenase superfamily)
VKFRLVVSDIDGTLLDDDGMLTERTQQVVYAVREAGIPFVLATSRRWTGTQPVAQSLGLHDVPLIIYDGTQTRCFPNGNVMAEWWLDAGVAQQAAEIIASHRLQPILQLSNAQAERLIVGKLPANSKTHTSFATRYLADYAHQVTEMAIEEFSQLEEHPLRLVAFGAYEHLLIAARKMVPLQCGVQVLPSGSYGAAELTVFSSHASKGMAMQKLCRQLGIRREEVFAIGDGVNDMALLQMAGFGVAMGNAADEIKAAARAVAPTNQEDGAAAAIERYVLRNAL